MIFTANLAMSYEIKEACISPVQKAVIFRYPLIIDLHVYKVILTRLLRKLCLSIFIVIFVTTVY